MSRLGIEYTIIEKSDRVGNAWHNHYDRLHLHTVKQWSHLPHMPFPEEYPTYVSRDQLIDYFENYKREFDIKPYFDQGVEHISRGENGWEVKLDNGNLLDAKKVIVATGVNRIPNVPNWPGEDQFAGTILHSRVYKNAKPFKGKKVLVIGMGNTGAELALDLSEHGIETYLSVRSPISIVPRDLNGRPVQVTAKQLQKLPFGIGDWLGTQIRKVYIGDIRKYGLVPSKMHPVQQLRETGKTPVVDIGTIKAVKEGKIKIVNEVNSFQTQGVTFVSGESMDVDAVLLCTGYRSGIGSLIEDGHKVLDKYGCPSSVVGKGEFEGMYFVGFDNYKVGGILGTILTDSETIAEDIVK